MHPSRSAFAEGRAVIGRRDALFVESVARFVNGAEETTGEIIFIDARGDAHVTRRELDHEGMVGFVLAAAVKIVAKILDHRLAEGPLLWFRKTALQAVVIHLGTSGDGLDQRRQGLPQRFEEGSDGRGAHAVVGYIDEGIGDVLIAGEEVGELTAHREGFLQVGLDTGEVVGWARLDPNRIAVGHKIGEFGSETGWDADETLVVAPRHPDQGRVVVVRRQALCVGLQSIQQLADGCVRGLFMGELAQGSQLTPACGRQLGTLSKVSP